MCEDTQAGHSVPSSSGDSMERKQAEAEQAHLAAIVASSPDAIIGQTLEGVIVSWNAAAERLYGYTAAEAVGKTLEALAAPNETEENAAASALIQQGETVSVSETTHVHKNGSRIEVAHRRAPIRDKRGSLIGISSVVRDMTEQNRASHTLRLLEAAVQQSHDAITITDANLEEPGPRIVFVNPAFTQITGYSAEEVLGRSPRFLQGHNTERSVLEAVRSCLSRGEPFSGETTNYRKDGAEFCMEWEISPIRNAKDEITYYVATQRDVTERRDTQLRLRRQFERLASLRAIDVSIITNLNLAFTLRLILEQAQNLLAISAADALLVNHETGTLEYAVRVGFTAGFIPPIILESTQHPAAMAAQEQRTIALFDLPDGGTAFLEELHRAGENVTDYSAIPLLAKGKLSGVLQFYQKENQELDQEGLEFLEALVGQASIAVENTRLFEELQRTNQEMLRSHDATIEGWSHALDLRDKETEGHSQRVTTMSMQLAEAMGLQGEALLQIRRGALLHDVGKLGIPDSILLKPGSLTEAEWETMRMHPTYAYEMLYPITFLRPALDIPYCHHEKWDGSGYPNGLAGEDIPLAARIFAIADVWDALRSNRPYRSGWPAEKVREHIQSLSGSHFDPAVASAFLQLDFQ